MVALFHLLDDGLDAFVARAVLANHAERSIDVQYYLYHDDNKNYVIAGWATVNEVAPGPPVWEQVASYLGNHNTVTVKKLNSPTLLGVNNNPGLSD